MATRREVLQLRTAEAINVFVDNPTNTVALPIAQNISVDKWRKLEKLMNKETSKWWEATAL